MNVATLSQPLPAHYNKVSLEREKEKKAIRLEDRARAKGHMALGQRAQPKAVWTGGETASQGLYDQRLYISTSLFVSYESRYLRLF